MKSAKSDIKNTRSSGDIQTKYSDDLSLNYVCSRNSRNSVVYFKTDYVSSMIIDFYCPEQCPDSIL